MKKVYVKPLADIIEFKLVDDLMAEGDLSDQLSGTGGVGSGPIGDGDGWVDE